MKKETLVEFIKANFYISSDKDLQFSWIEDTPAHETTDELLAFLRKAGITDYSKP